MSPWQHLKRIPIQYPFAFGMGVSTIKTSASDLLVQTVVENKREIDWKRNLAFATFGCFYLGGVQYAIYVPVFGRLFPAAAPFAAKTIKQKMKDTKGQIALLSQVFIDQCVHHPLMYFPVFYMTKEIVTSDGNPDFMAAMRTYKDNMAEDMKALWKIWVPATMVNFAFMPMWGRIPMVAATSMVWTCILSAMRGGDVVHSDELFGGTLRGATYQLMKEGIGESLENFATSVDFDPSLSHICVSAAGPDKVGWVSLVAGAVNQEGGNITHSKMVRLGHDFIVLMHVSAPPEKVRTLIHSLNSNEDLEPLNIRTSFLTKRQTGKYEKAMTGLKIHCRGKDRPGMLAAVSSKVSEANLSVENITTELVMNNNEAKGRRDFVINCDCTATKKLEKEKLLELFEDFAVLKEEQDFDVVDIRVHVADNTVARRNSTF
jgi:glycine cleavage system regulatory protein